MERDKEGRQEPALPSAGRERVIRRPRTGQHGKLSLKDKD